MLETTNGNDLLLTDSMTIGDLVDQKQHRHRTVVMDMGVGIFFPLRSDHHSRSGRVLGRLVFIE